MKRLFLLINSILVIVFAFLLTTLIHEFGHFLFYTFFKAGPELHHNYVSIPDIELSKYKLIAAALAGPLFSFIQGYTFLFLSRKRSNNSIPDLFILWLGIFGMINFFGYIMMTPLSTAGDTGKVAELLNIPYSIRILIAIIGLAILILIILNTKKQFSCFIPQTTSKKERGKYIYMILFIPIIIGSIINALFSFPVQVFLSVIYPLTSSYVVMIVFGKVLNYNQGIQLAKENPLLNKIPFSIIIPVLVVVILNRLLVYGFSF